MAAKIVRLAEDAVKHGVPAPVKVFYEAKGFRKGVAFALPAAMVVTTAGLLVLNHFRPELAGEAEKLASKAYGFVTEKANQVADAFDKAMAQGGRPAEQPAQAAEPAQPAQAAEQPAAEPAAPAQA